MWFWMPAALLTLCYSAIILWYRRAWMQLPEYSIPEDAPLPATRVSVVVAARNEEECIDDCLSGILSQHYPAHLLEVVVVNDGSEDNTAAKTAQWQQKDNRVKLVQLPPVHHSQAYKKRAIELGITRSSGELVVCTDADCTHPPNWIATLVHRYEKGETRFIAAPVMFHTRPTFLSVFQTLDFLSLQGITGASVSQNFHSMCNGANIAYSRKAFEEVNGFAGIDRLPSGDDMLLMYKMARRYPAQTTWLKSGPATVLTRECYSWREFFQQRIRWASKAAFYQDNNIFAVLLLVYLLNVCLLLMPLAALAGWVMWRYWISLLLIKTVAEAWFLWPVSRFFGKTGWMAWFPFFQIPHLAYTVLAGTLGRFGSYQWKGRIIQKPSAVTP